MLLKKLVPCQDMNELLFSEIICMCMYQLKCISKSHKFLNKYRLFFRSKPQTNLKEIKKKLKKNFKNPSNECKKKSVSQNTMISNRDLIMMDGCFFVITNIIISISNRLLNDVFVLCSFFFSRCFFSQFCERGLYVLFYL